MGWLGDIFKSGEIIDRSMDALDAIVYTDEEKAKASITKAKIKIELLKAYEPFKITQRYLAIMFGTSYVGAWLIVFFVSFFTDVSDQIDFLTNSTHMGQAVIVILGFFFFGGSAESVGRAIKK